MYLAYYAAWIISREWFLSTHRWNDIHRGRSTAFTWALLYFLSSQAKTADRVFSSKREASCVKFASIFLLCSLQFSFPIVTLTTSVARILQWRGGGVRMTSQLTIRCKAYTGADLRKFWWDRRNFESV